MSYQVQPWEQTDPTWVHISERDWFSLTRRPFFRDNWNRSDYGRQFPIIETCIYRGWSVEKTMTILKIWHRKHRKGFDEGDFWRLFQSVADRLTPVLMKKATKEYWEEVRRVQFDGHARDHSRMRVSYFLVNKKSVSTAREIAEGLSIPIKTVRNALATLQGTGKAIQEGIGFYKGVYSSQWDVATDPLDGEDEHPSGYYFGISPNQRTKTKMVVWDYSNDVPVEVGVDLDFKKVNGYDRYPDQHEWVLDSFGRVVGNGNAVFGVDLNSGETPVGSEDFDFFKVLTRAA